MYGDVCGREIGGKEWGGGVERDMGKAMSKRKGKGKGRGRGTGEG